MLAHPRRTRPRHHFQPSRNADNAWAAAIVAPMDATTARRYNATGRALCPQEANMWGRRSGITAAVWLALVMIAYAQDAPTFPPGGISEALKARLGRRVVTALCLQRLARTRGIAGPVCEGAPVPQ